MSFKSPNDIALAKAVRDRDRRRSGTPTTPNAKRTRPMVTLTLSSEALARLDAIALERGQSRSGAVEALVRNARMRTTDER